jgi:O-antigen/teichoic acid export membrane protein
MISLQPEIKDCDAPGQWMMPSTANSKPLFGSALVNTGWLVADSVIRLGVGLIVGIWIARYLGPEQFGLLSYAVAFVSLFSALSSLGLDRLVVREIVAGRLESSKILGTSFALKLAGGLTILILSTASAFLVNPGEPTTILLVAIAAAGAIAQSLDVVDYHFQAMIQSKYATIARAIAFHVLSATKIILILIKAPLVAFALAGLIESMLAAGLLLLTHHRKAPVSGRWRWDWLTARTLLREGWPLMFAGLMVMLYMRVDQVMLKNLSTAQEMGKYAGAVRLSEAWYFVLTAITASIFPKLVSANVASQEEFDSIACRFYAVMILVAYAFALPLSLFSGVLSSLLFGEQFRGMEGMLSVGAWAGLFVGIGLARGSCLTAKNLNTFQLVSTGLGALVNIALNLVLIPGYGGRGAAFATLISYALAGYISSFFYGPARGQAVMTTKLLLPWNAWQSFDWQQFVTSFRTVRGDRSYLRL